MAARMDRSSFTGVLICGGKSGRMGTPKGTLTLGGRSLPAIAFEKLTRICQEVILASNGPTPAGVPEVRTISDNPACKGALAGLLAGLKAMSTDRALVLGIDQPFIPVAFLGYLMDRSDGFDVVMPVAAQPQPLAAVYSRRAVSAYEARIANRRFDLRGILREPSVACRRIEAEQLLPYGDPSRMFFNINTPKHFAAARSWWNSTDYDRLMSKEAKAMTETEVGQVEHYFGKIGAAAVRISVDGLKIGDTIVIRGHSGELHQTVTSMQLEHQDITEAKPGQSIGLMVVGKVHDHDKVFKVSP